MIFISQFFSVQPNKLKSNQPQTKRKEGRKEWSERKQSLELEFPLVLCCQRHMQCKQIQTAFEYPPLSCANLHYSQQRRNNWMNIPPFWRHHNGGLFALKVLTGSRTTFAQSHNLFTRPVVWFLIKTKSPDLIWSLDNNKKSSKNNFTAARGGYQMLDDRVKRN